MTTDTSQNLFKKIGPGLLYAASAVGTSHLIQSTRAGADYSFGLMLIFIFVAILKYPGIRFGKDYALATGKNLIHSYTALGRGITLLYSFIIAMTMVFVTAALSLVTGAILQACLPFLPSGQAVPVGLILLTGFLLITGKYALLENINKVLVPLFTLLIFCVTLMSAIQIDWTAQSFSLPNMSAETILYVVVIAGWLLTPMDASVLLSLWTEEKSKLTSLSPKAAGFDFNLGYWMSLALALCFIFLGSSILYGAKVDLPNSGGAFATKIISLFSGQLGDWSFPIIGFIAVSIMFSTLITVMDGYARNVQTLIRITKPKFNRYAFEYGVVAVSIGAILVLTLFMTSFTTFIDLVGALVFILGPIYAGLNHRAVYGQEMPFDKRPSQTLRVWSLLSILIMTGVALAYIYFRLTSSV